MHPSSLQATFLSWKKTKAQVEASQEASKLGKKIQKLLDARIQQSRNEDVVQSLCKNVQVRPECFLLSASKLTSFSLFKCFYVSGSKMQPYS